MLEVDGDAVERPSDAARKDQVASQKAIDLLAVQQAPLPPVAVPSRSEPWWLLLDKVDGGVQYSHLDKPNVDGLSIRIRWSTIEPRNGVYDFDLIDKLAGQAKRRGKIWTLRIMAGTSSPTWIDCPTHGNGAGAFPLPWCDELTAAFDRLMMTLGAEFGDDPLLVMIHVPGFNKSAEMHMPNSRDWPADQMAEAWEHRIDATAAAFPRQLICLNHSPEKWSAAVIQWHERLGKERACFQMNALKATTKTTWTGYTTLEKLDNAGWPIGFQFVGPSTNTARFGGSLQQAIGKGTSAGARWYEFYQPDAGRIPQ